MIFVVQTTALGNARTTRPTPRATNIINRAGPVESTLTHSTNYRLGMAAERTRRKVIGYQGRYSTFGFTTMLPFWNTTGPL